MMAFNNTATLIGNLGDEARIYETEESDTFAALRVATTDSYKDKNEEWQEKETVWHNVLVFNPTVIAVVKSLKKGTRVKVTGSISYRPFDVVNGDGEVITKKEATIMAGKVELAPLAKKRTG